MWFNILKDKWAMFTKNILKDKWPTNRKKYVKFSNLDDINQRMVKFYLEKGKHKPQHRKVYVKQILVEMEKSSNARFDLEKFDEPLSFQGWEQITNDNNPFKAKHPDRTGFEYSLLHRELKVFVGSHFLGSIKNRGGFGRYGDNILVHMNPEELSGLASLGQITYNPVTGLPEAFSLKGLFKGIRKLAPVVLAVRASKPSAVLLFAVVLASKDKVPTAVF